jgi:hypothetical protein
MHILAALQISGLLGRVSISSLAMTQAGILAASIIWSVLSSRSTPSRSVSNPQSWPKYLLITTALLAGSYALFAFNLFTSYPEGTDALAYHLPLALHWLQTGSLAIPASKAWRFSMPGNAEIGMMLLLATGNQSSAVLVNWIALAVLAISTYLLAQRIGHENRLVSALIVLLLLSVPMVEFQTFSAYVDLFGTAFLVAAFALFLCRGENQESKRQGGVQALGRPAVLFLSAAACGISLGTKPIYDLYGAAYVASAAFSLWNNVIGSQRASRALATALTLLGAGVLLPSIFWFGRAYQETHNPLFPMRVAFAGHVIFPGNTGSQFFDEDFDLNFVHTRTEWLIYPWTEWKRNPGYPTMTSYGEGSGLGAAFASLVPAGIAFLLYGCLRRKTNKLHVLLLLTLLVFSCAWWFPLRRIPRYGLPIVVLMCLMAAPLVGSLALHHTKAFWILFVSSLAATCVISTFVPFHELAGRLRTHRSTRADVYNYPPVLDRLAPGTCVMNATKQEERNFSLAGAALSNCVVTGFEVPPELTSQFLRENNVGYIAEIVPKNANGLDQSRLPELELLRDEVIKADQYSVRWRIWAVKPLGSAMSASSYLRNR